MRLACASEARHADGMSATENEVRKVVREEIKGFGIGIALFVLMALCAVNVFILLFIVPKFQQIFMDALPGKPLPLVTLGIIQHSGLLSLIALAWPIIGILMRKWQKPYTSAWIYVGLVLFFLAIGITIFAMFTPMIGLGGGMSDDPK